MEKLSRSSKNLLLHSAKFISAKPPLILSSGEESRSHAGITEERAGKGNERLHFSLSVTIKWAAKRPAAARGEAMRLYARVADWRSLALYVTYVLFFTHASPEAAMKPPVQLHKGEACNFSATTKSKITRFNVCRKSEWFVPKLDG